MDTETMAQDSSKDGLGSENTSEKFYSPLSVTGYLTPLQRKKLREKRGLLSPVFLESNKIKKDIKANSVKRKKEIKPNLSSKREKRTKHKELSPQIQCSAARVICKTNSNLKEKKFFKTSSSNRLEKASFCMPFVFKKNLFSMIDKNIKENSLPLKRPPILKEHCVDLQSSHDSIDNKEKINLEPIIIRISNEISNLYEDSLKKELEEEKIKPTQTLFTDFDFDWPSDEMLLKRQEEARKNIKKQKALNKPVEDNKEVQQNNDKPVEKLYPIFYIASRKQSERQLDNKRKQRNAPKRFKDSSKGGEQMVIDAGQKEFGAKICSTCNMIYSVGVEEDERLHLNYHNVYLINLKFNGWKDENVIGEYTDGRIIMVRKSEQSFKIKKIEDVLEIVNRDLGFPTSSLPQNSELTFILFISNAKQVVGCVVAEPISQASRVLQAEDSESIGQKESTWRIGNWYSSCETFPAVCGVNRIWVAHNCRRNKVASRMIDCLRCRFVHGHVIGIQELAFTDPSPDGREFAASYTGTNHFLVYK